MSKQTPQTPTAQESRASKLKSRSREGSRSRKADSASSQRASNKRELTSHLIAPLILLATVIVSLGLWLLGSW